MTKRRHHRPCPPRKRRPWRETKQARYKARKPWVRHVEFARRRCAYGPGTAHYQYYGGKGITCDLSATQAEVLWKRDGAAAMKKPTLDRVDPDKNYTLTNCRFVEHLDNSRAPHQAKTIEELAPDVAVGEVFDDILDTLYPDFERVGW